MPKRISDDEIVTEFHRLRMTETSLESESLLAHAEEILLLPDLAVHLFNKNPDALVVATHDGLILLVNEQAELLFGYHKSEMHGKPVEMLLPEAKRLAHQQHRAHYMDEPRVRPMGLGLDLQAQRKNGTSITVEINLSPLATTKGILVLATIRKKAGGGTATA